MFYQNILLTVRLDNFSLVKYIHIHIGMYVRITKASRGRIARNDVNTVQSIDVGTELGTIVCTLLFHNLDIYRSY